MTFKKEKIKKKSPLTINIVGTLGVFFVFILGFLILQNTNFINIKIPGNNSQNSGEYQKVEYLFQDAIEDIQDISQSGNEENNTNSGKESLSGIDKDNIKNFILSGKDDRVNILIVGRGGGDHDAPNLTDTMILASINTKNEIISMLSIPRDLYVEYGSGQDGRINRIYETYLNKSESEEIGMIAIADKVSQLTGQKIDFFVNIDFQGFEKIIDVIGGVELTIEQPFVDYQYPDGKGGYTTIVFRKGTWLFDGENALKYARSRHSTSDFDRSIRQQQIIDAIKKKLSASYFIKSPSKIKELYETVNQYIYTNMKLTDILKLALKIKGNDYKTLSFNLNDSCFYGSSSCSTGGLLYVPNREYFGGASVLLIEGTDKNNLSNYTSLYKYANLIFNNQGFFEENYKINIFNSLNVNFLASLLSDKITKYGFYIPKINGIGNTKKTYEKSIIYYNDIKENSQTIQALKDFFPKAIFEKTKAPKYAKELDTKIEIIIGKDYQNIFYIN